MLGLTIGGVNGKNIIKSYLRIQLNIELLLLLLGERSIMSILPNREVVNNKYTHVLNKSCFGKVEAQIRLNMYSKIV